MSVQVDFRLQDALAAPDDRDLWDIVVSNPPYICEKEEKDMAQNVLDYEPHLALFVPDSDPLRFYRAIAQYAAKALKPQGRLFFEINPVYAAELVAMLQAQGYGEVELQTDTFGKQRMIQARRP